MTYITSMRRAAALIATLTALPSLATAQEFTFTPQPAPAERPYPYEILGLQPGDSLDDVMAVLSERSDTEPTTETDVISVQSPDGRSLEFNYELSRQIGGLTLNEILAEVNFAESIKVSLLTDVMEQRPFSITRSMRLPTAELPTAQELQAQMEETYGPPTLVETTIGTVTLTYSWNDQGFITNYETQPGIDLTYVDRYNREQTIPYQPCMSFQPHATEAYIGQPQYGFQYPRKLEIMPGCMAQFIVTHSSKPGNTAISFDLIDYDLARQHRTETDRQIVEFLTGAQNAEPSKLEL